MEPIHTQLMNAKDTILSHKTPTQFVGVSRTQELRSGMRPTESPLQLSSNAYSICFAASELKCLALWIP